MTMSWRVLEPFRLGPLALRNRIVFAPITTQYAAERGAVSDRLIAHYERRAEGGVGLVIVEATCVDQVGQVFFNQLGIYADEHVSGLRDLAVAIKRHGSAAAIQLHHGGRMAKMALTSAQPVGPSALAAPGGVLPRELTAAEIKATVQTFVEAAVRAQEAGFGGVEIHGAHGYLVDQFISPAVNHREDAYGGSVENRARLLIEILCGIKAAAGLGFPVWVRLNAREYGVDGGTTLEDALEVARMAEAVGAFAVHVSAYGPSSPTNRTTAVFQPAVIEDLASAVKDAVTVPVIAVGRITPQAAESMIVAEKADLIAMGKALLADPDIPRKLEADREDRILPCIVCMHCRDVLYSPVPAGISCQVNPRLGCDHEAPCSETTSPKKVLVIGGGPAGMVAAMTAAERGHRVALWEQDAALGGQLLAAAIPPHKDRIRAFVSYCAEQLARTGVTVELEHEATVEAIVSCGMDEVILACGPIETMPDIPGIASAGAVKATAVLNGLEKVGKRVVIVGGELVGCETAEYLAERGRSVVVVRRGPEMATRVGPSLRQFFLERLRQKGVTLLPGVRYVRASPDHLTVEMAGEIVDLPVDTLVYATGFVADTRLYYALHGRGASVRIIGDCATPRGIGEAVREGYAAGCTV